MQRTGTVNYHVHKAERQAFEIDVGGIPGNLVSPELVTMRVSLADLRDGRTEVSFGSDGFAFVRAPSEVADFDTGAGWQDVYDRELAGLLRRDLGAADVVVFDHTLRTDDPDAERRRPATSTATTAARARKAGWSTSWARSARRNGAGGITPS